MLVLNSEVDVGATQALAAFVADTSWAELPVNVVEAAKTAILDGAVRDTPELSDRLTFARTEAAIGGKRR